MKTGQSKKKRKLLLHEVPENKKTKRCGDTALHGANVETSDGDNLGVHATPKKNTLRPAMTNTDNAKSKRHKSQGKSKPIAPSSVRENHKSPLTLTNESVSHVRAGVTQAEDIHQTCLETYNENLRQCCDDILKQIKEREIEMLAIIENENGICKHAQIEDMIHSMVNVVNVQSPEILDDTNIAFTKQHANTKVEGIRRSWEESYLMEPTQNELPCLYSNTNECVATEMFKEEFGETFTLKEFFTPNDLLTGKNNLNGKDRVRQPCILCLRNNVLSSVLQLRSTGERCCTSNQLSRIHNFVGINGEYLIDHCVCSLPNCYEGLIDPVVMPLKCYFEPHKLNGIKCLNQTIPRPEDVYQDF